MNTERELKVLGAVLDRLVQTPGCCLGYPGEKPLLPVPPLVESFYERCSGVALFWGGEGACQVLSPAALVPTDDVMFGGVPPDPNGPSSAGWILIADEFNGYYVSLDTNPGPREGWIYATELGRFGTVGDCPVIARSLAEFLTHVLDHGGYWYWEEPGFPHLGDAYDGWR